MNTSVFHASAQNNQGQARLDSLLAEVPRMKEDTHAVRLMNYISDIYKVIDPNEGLKWASKSLKLSQKLDWSAGEALAYKLLGNNYNNKGAYPDALNAYFNCLRVIETKENQTYTAPVLANIGTVYQRQKNYDKALEYDFKALKAAGVRGDQELMQIVLGNIGLVLEVQGKFTEALDYKKKSLAIAEQLGDKNGIIVQTGNIGATYTSLKQYPEALAYGFRSLRTAQEAGDKQSIAINLGNIGENYYLIAVDSNAPKADNLVPASREVNLARAVDYLQKGILACREAYFPEGIPEFSDYLSKALVQQGQPARALEAFRQSVAVKDSLYNTENNQKIAAMETQRAMDLKDKDLQIAKLKKRNERVLFISGFAVLLLIMGMLLRGYKRQQKSNRLLQKEKKRSDTLLLNILPAEVAEELKDHGVAAARQFDEVSVLFTDFVNFTRMAEQLTPQEVVKELHECFSAFDAICTTHGLEKIKTIGDAYMAVCGMPVTDPCHAQKTVRAAIEILNFMKARSLKERAFEIRIGIHSGPVVAGIVGTKKFAYDIWGDTVNTAARMESASEPGRVNISHRTYQLVKDDYKCSPRGKISAKGKGEVEMYFAEPTASLTS